MRFTILAILMSCCIPAFAGDIKDHITIDLKREWTPTGFHASGVKAALKGQVDLSGEFPKFSLNEGGSRAIFDYPFHLPIEMTQYPTFTLKYRAKNLDANNTYTCIWITEGERGAIYPLIDFDKLIVDGQIHQIQVDLPTAPTGSQGTPFQNGPVKGVLVSVMNRAGAPGSIELIDLTFSSASDPPHTQEADQPIQLRVLDPQGQPVQGASLTVDAERKDAARQFKTDAKGRATIVAIKNELDRHAIRIAAPRLLAVTKLVDSSAGDAGDVTLPKGMQVGGFVQDEAGKPIADATVSVIVGLPRSGFDPSLEIDRSSTVRTDARGQWLSTPLPESDDIYFVVTHPDYPSDTTFRKHPEMLDELRSGIATFVLKK